MNSDPSDDTSLEEQMEADAYARRVADRQRAEKSEVLDRLAAVAAEFEQDNQRMRNAAAKTPAFEDIRTDAVSKLEAVMDLLRTVWRPGTGPTEPQRIGVDRAHTLIAQARWLLNKDTQDRQ